MNDAIWIEPEDEREFERMCEIEERWETASAVLSELGGNPGDRALHVNVQGSAWLPALSRWVGTSGRVDVAALTDDEEITEWVEPATRAIIRRAELANVGFVTDDVAEQGGYDLVVCYRTQYGMEPEEGERILDRALDCVRAGGWFCVVEFYYRSWTYAPASAPLDGLNAMIQDHAEADCAMDFSAGRLPGIFRRRGLRAALHADCAALAPGTLLQDKPYEAAAEGSGISDPVRSALGAEEVDRARALAYDDAYDERRWTLSPAIVTAYGRTAA